MGPSESGPRRFDVRPLGEMADPVALSVGLYAYTGQGKTESSLRLAYGMRRVVGGRVFFADCDNGRGQHFRGLFPDAEYIDFKAPHNALDYVDLLEQFAHEQGVLVIDNMTAEHEGEGGLLDTKEAAMYDRNGHYKEGRSAVAWGVAKEQHKKLVRAFVRVNRKLPILVTWRAQEKLDWSAKNDQGKSEPKSLGEMPIGSKDLPFEMTATYLLPPGSKGAPCLAPVSIGERMMTKIPRWFDGIVKSGDKFTEGHGEAMARWAFGAPKTPKDPDVAEMRAAFDAARTLQQIEAAAAEWGPRFPKEDRKRRPVFVRAYTDAKARAEGASSAPPKPPSNPGRPPTEPPPHPEDFDRSA
jgi:hypothetical protein